MDETTKPGDAPRKGWYLRVFVSEKDRHDGRPTYDWLLDTARALQVRGGSVIRAAAGYGRRGTLRDEGFFELAGELPMEVGFVLDAAGRDALLKAIAEAGLSLFYCCSEVEFGVTGA
ncbi:DUF190 domain-containing protein [Solimonas flava]|uniref:DUF190 domain-containing protein n=1 Tax=Solimonas flava TaxID=415849 RepID=UPI00041F3DAF|nr:DUF190 domain-containing protein [Solimonas flava]